MSNERMLSALRAVRRLQFTDHHRLLEDRELDEIAQRYGPLEFTREEVRGIDMQAFADGYALGSAERGVVASLSAMNDHADQTLSRHTESEGGDTPTIKASEESKINRQLILDVHSEVLALTKRLAAIEKRVLAEGHHKRCKWALAANFYERADVEAECTCDHDKIRNHLEQPQEEKQDEQ